MTLSVSLLKLCLFGPLSLTLPLLILLYSSIVDKQTSGHTSRVTIDHTLRQWHWPLCCIHCVLCFVFYVCVWVSVVCVASPVLTLTLTGPNRKEEEERIEKLPNLTAWMCIDERVNWCPSWSLLLSLSLSLSTAVHSSSVYLPLFKWLPSSSVVKNLFKFTFGRMDTRLDATFVGLVSSHRGNCSCVPVLCVCVCVCVCVDVDVDVDEVWVAISTLEPLVYFTHRWWSRQRSSWPTLVQTLAHWNTQSCLQFIFFHSFGHERCFAREGQWIAIHFLMST